MDSAGHCVLQSRYSTFCVVRLLTDLCVLQTRLYLFSMCGVMIVSPVIVILGTMCEFESVVRSLCGRCILSRRRLSLACLKFCIFRHCKMGSLFLLSFVVSPVVVVSMYYVVKVFICCGLRCFISCSTLVVLFRV